MSDLPEARFARVNFTVHSEPTAPGRLTVEYSATPDFCPKKQKAMRRAGYRLTYGYPRWHRWLAVFAMALGWGALAALLIVALFYGMVKEEEGRDELRRERCAAMGENITPELQPYCDNLGV